MLDNGYVKKALRTAYRDSRIVWGSSTLRDAIIMREAASAIMAQSEESTDGTMADAQAIILQFREVADEEFPGA